MKKLLIVADTYFPRVDGIMRFLLEVIPRIANSFDITLLVPYFGTSWSYNEVKIKPSKIIKLSGYQSMRLSLGNIKRIKRAVKDSDSVFIQGPALISIFALHYAKKYNKSVSWYTHLIMWELYDKNLPRILRWLVVPILRKLTIRWYNNCDTIVVPYKNLINQLTELGINSNKVVAQLGVDIETLKPRDKAEAKKALGIDPSYHVIGYVGRISAEKNVKVLVDAFKSLQGKHKIILLAVGSGTKQSMKLFEDTRNVVLPGFVRDVENYYAAMDIFVMPSLTETTSLATLEAMASGVPVITTKVGFLKEYVIRNHNGLLFPKGNVYTLILQLRKLITRPILREQMSKNARATALKFSWDKTAERIKDILEKF
jgi:glycosyltransferase involved in cell wall biosynthesis